MRYTLSRHPYVDGLDFWIYVKNKIFFKSVHNTYSHQIQKRS